MESNNKNPENDNNFSPKDWDGNNDFQDLDQIYCQDDSDEDSSEFCNKQCPLTAKINTLSEKVKHTVEAVNDLTEQLKQSRTSEQIIARLSEQSKLQNEQFYERETLSPVLLRIISICDKCRKQVEELGTIQSKNKNLTSKIVAYTLNYLIEARKMDIIELEDALANFGVEPFEHPEGTFNPSSQKCISPVETHDRKLHRKIARRLLPGYQRQEKIIRKEYINIYVFKNNKITQKGGK